MRPISAVSLTGVALSAIVAFAPLGSAQTTTTQHNTLIAIDPLGIPWDIFQAEMETGIGAGATIGGVFSYTDINSDRNTTFDLKARYYPSEELFNKLSTGLSFGYTRFSRPGNDASQTLICVAGTFDCTGNNIPRATLDAPTIGVILDYDWMHGASRRFVVGTGLGAKRILASSAARERVGLDRAYVTARFVIGIAF